MTQPTYKAVWLFDEDPNSDGGTAHLVVSELQATFRLDNSEQFFDLERLIDRACDVAARNARVEIADQFADLMDKLR